jgi:hypothetical protein
MLGRKFYVSIWASVGGININCEKRLRIFSDFVYLATANRENTPFSGVYLIGIKGLENVW